MFLQFVKIQVKSAEAEPAPSVNLLSRRLQRIEFFNLSMIRTWPDYFVFPFALLSSFLIEILPHGSSASWQMKMVSVVLSRLTFLLLPLLAPIVFAQGGSTQCYVIDGAAADNSGYRCDNSTTGNSACCAAGATCYSNGLCKQDNGPTVDYLRVGCTDQTWEDPACLNQCAACK